MPTFLQLSQEDNYHGSSNESEQDSRPNDAQKSDPRQQELFDSSQAENTEKSPNDHTITQYCMAHRRATERLYKRHGHRDMPTL